MGSLVDERGYCLPAQTVWVSFLHLLCLVNHMYIENKYENHHLCRTRKTYLTNIILDSIEGMFFMNESTVRTLNLPAVVVVPSTPFKCDVMFGMFCGDNVAKLENSHVLGALERTFVSL